MDLQADLLAVATAYQAATGLSQARVSTLVANDGKFLKGLTEGGSCTIRRFEAVMRWFSDHWPDDAAWPEGVSRVPRAVTAKPEAA